MTSKQDMCEMIAATQLFADASWNDVEAFSKYVQCFVTPAGTVIFKEGDAGNFLCLLVKGEVDIFKEDHAGKAQRIASVSKGKTIGEMSIIDSEPRSATCIAFTDSVVLMLTKDNFARIIKERPGLAVFILSKLAKLMSQRLRGMSGQLVEHLGREAG
ncbi:cyclic nucleotide-binding domain-containing protein [Noviherbaspirillum massiliense]|uniref:cyclic nucleotide-binding domain-containing protein n=1 Tax=Noviherbaspirillum massiliense TaxID=1465823 RepID=UPI0003800510|nr:cyclic nucleotide-binding domain-containing protein [Noviherbaspirillum massiliense]